MPPMAGHNVASNIHSEHSSCGSCPQTLPDTEHIRSSSPLFADMETNHLNQFPFLGGIASSHGLYEAGFGRPDIRRALTHGTLTRVRQGWYALSSPQQAVRRAVAAGGILGCQSALAFHGVWVPDTPTIHVRRSQHGRRQPAARSVRFCEPRGVLSAPIHAVDDVRTALRTAALCADDQELVVLMDSVLNLRLLTPTQLRHSLDDLSSRHRALVGKCDLAESGTETLTRLALRAQRIKVLPQAEIPGVGRVDFLVGRCLVIEVDSRSHHTDPTSYHRDRLRDQRLVALGYFVVRLTYQQVIFDLPATIGRLLPVIRSEAHRRAVRIYSDT